MPVRLIALEEHFLPPQAERDVSDFAARRDLAAVRTLLTEVSEARVRAMDAGGVEIAVLSVTSPGIQAADDVGRSAEAARSWNDTLYELTNRFPDRFRAFAALPMHDPERGAGELLRAVTELGFVGGLVNGYDNAGGGHPRYYDDRSYLPFWRLAAELGVPIYLHPRSAPRDRVTTYSGYSELAGAAWGFHVETAEHVLRLMRGGVFDAVPDVQVVLGHLGEMLPFMARRIDHMVPRDLDGEESGARGRHSVAEYLRQNILITTSGFFNAPALTHALSVMGPERVLYAVDYPYESMTEAWGWFDSLELDDRVKERIGFQNACRLLGLCSPR